MLSLIVLGSTVAANVPKTLLLLLLMADLYASTLSASPFRKTTDVWTLIEPGVMPPLGMDTDTGPDSCSMLLLRVVRNCSSNRQNKV